MKNLLIYINPSKTFFGMGQHRVRDCNILAKIQIDNSLDLGWHKEDILLFTNFEYEYNGIKARVLDQTSYCDFRPLSTKTVSIHHLVENKLVEKDELYWVHDFDAYQLNPINESEIGLGSKDIGLTDYGWQSKWCLGSYFFKKSAEDIFRKLKDTVYEIQNEDERALNHMMINNELNIQKRYKKLNITYNFGMRHVKANYEIATKPLKVLHFHPYYRDTKMPTNALNCFMYGKNELKIPLMSDRLIKIFQHHGIK